jgi:hypothetical protein
MRVKVWNGVFTVRLLVKSFGFPRYVSSLEKAL